MRLSALLASGAAALVLSACGSGGESAAGSYVGRASNARVFIQWTRAGNSLTGSLQEAIAKEGEGAGVESSSRAFTGTTANNGLTLTLNEGLGSTKALVGRMTGQGFVLTFPGAHHGLITITFAPGQVSDYNAAVDELEAQSTPALATAPNATTPTTRPEPSSGESSATPTRGALVGNDCESLPGPSGQYAITAGVGVSCPIARKVFGDLFTDKGEHHEGADSAESYTRVDGWTCGSGTGGFGCSLASARIEADLE